MAPIIILVLEQIILGDVFPTPPDIITDLHVPAKNVAHISAIFVLQVDWENDNAEDDVIPILVSQPNAIWLTVINGLPPIDVSHLQNTSQVAQSHTSTLGAVFEILAVAILSFGTYTMLLTFDSVKPVPPTITDDVPPQIQLFIPPIIPDVHVLHRMTLEEQVVHY